MSEASARTILLPDGVQVTLSANEYALLRRWLYGRADRGSTHWEGCELAHHDCALMRLNEAREELAAAHVDKARLRAAASDDGARLAQLLEKCGAESFGFTAAGWRALKEALRLAKAQGADATQECASHDRKPRVYVAGPYTKGDVAVNVRNAIYAGHWLARAGCVPFVPHLSHLSHLVHPQPYEFWIEQDLAWLAACDALVRLPGESAGADGEEAEARRLGLPVFYAPEGELCAGLAEWLKEWSESGAAAAPAGVCVGMGRLR